DRRALRIEQDGVLGRRRKHSSFLEAGDEDVRTSGVSSVRQRAGVEVAGTWTFGRDVQRLNTFADEAQRPGQRARERAEGAQLRDVVDERRCRPMVEGALPCR